MRDQDILSTEQIEGSDYYRGFARPAGVGYFACALLDGGPADFVAISLQRDQRSGFVSDEDRARLQEMLPALQRSVRLARGLRERSIETLFDNQADDNAVQLLLDADGRVRRGEGAAAFLERLGLRIAHGFLMGRDARSDVAIARALAAVVGGVASEMLVMDACGLPLAKLGFSPVAGQAHDLLGRGDALVRVAAIDQPWRDARLVSRLAQLFSLTAAEQRVLLPLLSGAGTEEIAQASGYTRESVRTWMKSILFKSGCNSRAALLALARRLENG
jgi:DNA-binding CsgD family transcriptional regulator